jgi:hypothetical protein
MLRGTVSERWNKYQVAKAGQRWKNDQEDTWILAKNACWSQLTVGGEVGLPA